MNSREKLWAAVLVAAALVRLATLAAYPLNDTTEARYAEIGRLMATSGDWVTPRVEPDTPFWGKPPLSFWMTAASFRVFGSGEWQARAPVYAVTLVTLGLIVFFGRRTAGRESGLAAAAIVMTSAVGFAIAGAVMTDATLLAAATLAMVAFWIAVEEGSRRWGYVYFVAIALGLLAKGPVILVMAGLPVAAWLLAYHRLGYILRCLPWLGGTALVVALAAPWYALAESRTPGFLNYFLVGEHWLRFVDSGWQGDLYGEAHAMPHGTIWLYGVLAALPWSLVAIFAARSRGLMSGWRAMTPLKAYLLIWMITPLAFFTLAGNILPTYVATGLPAFALLLASALRGKRAAWSLPAVLVPLAILGIVFAPERMAPEWRSQRDLIAYARDHGDGAPLYYYRRKPHSADFYSHGEARLLESEQQLEAVVTGPNRALLAVRKQNLDELPDTIRRCAVEAVASRRYALLDLAGHDKCRSL